MIPPLTTAPAQLPGTSCAHCVWLDAEEMRLMAAAGASVIHNPLSNLRLGQGSVTLSLCTTLVVHFTPDL